MLFNFTKTFTLLTFAIVGLAPLNAKAATCSYASHNGIGDGYDGQITASGERFNAYGLSTAHRSMRLGSRLRVTNPENGRSVVVRVNDRGPFVGGRDLDLSYGAFSSLTSPGRGEVRVCYTQV
jgi:rare lipoprotein A